MKTVILAESNNEDFYNEEKYTIDSMRDGRVYLNLEEHYRIGDGHWKHRNCSVGFSREHAIMLAKELLEYAYAENEE